MTTEQLSMSMLANRADYDAEAPTAIESSGLPAEFLSYLEGEDAPDLQAAETLPEGLNIAIEMIGEYVESIVVCHRHPVTGELAPHVEINQRHEATAIDAIRAEHQQRVTLQHHAADQARRIADLIADSEAKIPEMQAALDERLTLDRANRLLVARIAELEAERDRIQSAHDNMARAWRADRDERDTLSGQMIMLESDMRLMTEERDELRARLDASKTERASLMQNMGNIYAENKDLRAQHPAAAGQEPAAWSRKEDAEWMATRGYMTVSSQRDGDWCIPLYAAPVPAHKEQLCDCGSAECGWRGPISECSMLGAIGPLCPICGETVESDATVPAQASPEGWRLVPVEPTREMFRAAAAVDDAAYADGSQHGADVSTLWDAMLAASPEAAR